MRATGLATLVSLLPSLPCFPSLECSSRTGSLPPLSLSLSFSSLVVKLREQRVSACMRCDHSLCARERERKSEGNSRKGYSFDRQKGTKERTEGYADGSPLKRTLQPLLHCCCRGALVQLSSRGDRDCDSVESDQWQAVQSSLRFIIHV